MSEDFIPRSRQTHADQCALLQGPLCEHFATTYGLTRDSILNSSRYFHVTEALIPDAMHDLLEGVLPYETKELIKYFISENVITLKELNSAIESFPYVGSDSKNKPIPISSSTLHSADHLLKQTGNTVMCVHILIMLTTYCSYTDVVLRKTTSSYDWSESSRGG